MCVCVLVVDPCDRERSVTRGRSGVEVLIDPAGVMAASLLQSVSQLSLAQASNRARVGASEASPCSRKAHWLRAGRFTGLRREAPLRRERLQRREEEWWQFGDRACFRGLGLKPVLAGLSGVPEGNLGLYDPSLDKDACGVGFLAELSAKPNRKIVSGSCFDGMLS